MSVQVDPTQYDAGDEKLKFSDLFHFNHFIGNGSFGHVVAAQQKPSMKECAVKIIMKRSLKPKYLESLMKEAQILKQLNHPNIVQFLTIHESETRLFLVMELGKGGQLQLLIKERNKAGKPLNDEEASVILKSIFSGLQFIHSKDIIHRDLKPENIILIDKEKLTSVKICDFGLSTQYDNANCTRSFLERCGTDIYMAPELWNKKRYSKPIDMFSCGIIMYMLLSGGKHPIYQQGDNQETYLKKLEEANWPMLSNFNRYSKDLFLKLVHADPYERYTIEQVQNHPWITRRFNEDIPLTSSEKIAAFSHSQIMSRIIKSMYLMYSLQNAPKSKAVESCKDVHKSDNPEEKNETYYSFHVDSLNPKSQNIDEKARQNFGREVGRLKIAIIEEEEGTHHEGAQSSGVNKEKPASSGLPPRSYLTPNAADLTKKTNQSTVQTTSTMPSNRNTNTLRDKEVSGFGSLNELETTQGSNPSFQLEDKIIKADLPSCSDIGYQAEQVMAEEEKQRPRYQHEKMWSPDRIISTTGNVGARKRDVKVGRVSEKKNAGSMVFKEGCSIDVGLRSEIDKSTSKINDSRLQGMDYITDMKYSSVDSLDTVTFVGSTGHFPITSENITPRQGIVVRGAATSGNTRIIKHIGEADGVHAFTVESSVKSLVQLNDKKPDEAVSRKQLMKRKVRKVTLDAAGLPQLKAKARVASIPTRKKNLKDKSTIKDDEAPKSQNMIGYSNNENTGPGERVLSSRIQEDRKPIASFKKVPQDKKPATHHELLRKNNPLLITYKTPLKEENEGGLGLPLIKPELRKTKMDWINNSDKQAGQKVMTEYGNTAPRAPKQLFKPMTPFKATKG